MTSLGELAQLIRSMDAGPFWLTVDAFFAERLATLAGNLRALGAAPAVHVAAGGTHSDPAGTGAAQDFILKLLGAGTSPAH